MTRSRGEHLTTLGATMTYAHDIHGTIGLTEEVATGILHLSTDMCETYFVFGGTAVADFEDEEDKDKVVRKPR